MSRGRPARWWQEIDEVARSVTMLLVSVGLLIAIIYLAVLVIEKPEAGDNQLLGGVIGGLMTSLVTIVAFYFKKG